MLSDADQRRPAKGRRYAASGSRECTVREDLSGIVLGQSFRTLIVEAELKSGFDERDMRSTLFCSCKMVENTRRQLSMLEAGLQVS